MKPHFREVMNSLIFITLRNFKLLGNSEHGLYGIDTWIKFVDPQKFTHLIRILTSFLLKTYVKRRLLKLKAHPIFKCKNSQRNNKYNRCNSMNRCNQNNCWLSFAIVRLLYDVTMRARVSDFKRILIGWNFVMFDVVKQPRIECTSNDLFWFCLLPYRRGAKPLELKYQRDDNVIRESNILGSSQQLNHVSPQERLCGKT